MCKQLSQWSPSEAAIDLIKLQGITDQQIDETLRYLKNQTQMKNIDDIDAYDNWNTLFIMLCIKAHKAVD